MIVSTTNSKVKRLTSLTHKAKARRDEGVFVAEGIKMFLEAPEEWIQEIYVSELFLEKMHNDKSGNSGKNKQLMDTLSKQKYEVVSEEVYKKISDTQTPQGILAVLRQPQHSLEQAVVQLADGNAIFFMILENIQDPGNLGTILRAGEGAGISGVIMTKESADIFNPKVIRSTMGSIYRVPFYIVGQASEAISLLQQYGTAVYAADLESQSVDYDKKDYTGATAFVIGNEAAGLRRETADCATGRIRIPMAGKTESLNAAMAATVLMYEVSRQRRGGLK